MVVLTYWMRSCARCTLPK